MVRSVVRVVVRLFMSSSWEVWVFLFMVCVIRNLLSSSLGRVF